jgi:hypothetical protein
VPRDTLEAAMIDGASRWERIRYVVLPSLKPLILFVLLVQLMDNFRVFEPIISFNAASNATSLAYSIYSSLKTQTVQLFGSAAGDLRHHHRLHRRSHHPRAHPRGAGAVCLEGLTHGRRRGTGPHSSRAPPGLAFAADDVRGR